LLGFYEQLPDTHALFGISWEIEQARITLKMVATFAAPLIVCLIIGHSWNVLKCAEMFISDFL
jgi:hypothetical protein